MMRRSVKREFFGNVIPSMIAFAFTGVYAIVDGFFVGRNVGDAGLAAINVAYPLVALIQAAGTGLGMAGAIQIAINKGKGDEGTERRYLGNAFVLLLLAGILLTGLLLMFYPVILRLFGASGEIYTYGAGYIRIIAAGAAIQVFSTGMMPIIRNYDGAVTAMAAMVAGFVTNIIFDWLFVSVPGLRGGGGGRGNADGTGGDGGAGSDLPYKEGRAVPLCLLSSSGKCGPLSSGYRGFPFWADACPPIL